VEQFKQFSIEKQSAIDTLGKLRGILRQLHEMGIDVSDDGQKIADALQAIESDVLRIALLGAFSDGKTSVVAAWLGRIMADMKIDMDESSDRLAIYKPEGLPGECEIVDTPGLFGDKEREIDGEQVMYGDVTKRYISEAHVIFYVVDATNPLKDSHNAIAKWILRDLDKLSSTVFVINKMDTVTDLTEQALFAEQAAIKKDNLKLKLQRAAGLSARELDALNIVCMASNPNGRGLPFWFGKPEIYESRSRLNDLKSMTSRVLKENVRDVLIAKTGLDVVRDIVGKRVSSVQAQLQELETWEAHSREESGRIQQDIAQGRREVIRLADELIKELIEMENRLIGKLRPLSLDDIRPFLEDEIGFSEQGMGYKLGLKVSMAVNRFFDQSADITARISVDIGRQLDSSESFLEALGENALRSVGGALNGVSKVGPHAVKTVIFTARDVLGQVTGVVFKFKPWQATKIATAVTKWAGPLGGAISLATDTYAMYKAHELEEELREVKDEVTKVIQQTFKDVYDLFKEKEKSLAFAAPQLVKYEQVVNEINRTTEQLRTSRDTIMQIQSELHDIAVSTVTRTKQAA
jgi:GTPase SAR1 family protein